MSVKFTSTLLALALAAGVTAMPATAQVDDPPAEWTINTSGWRGGAFQQPESDAFSHCGIGRQHQNGVTTIFSMNRRYETTLGLLSEDFAFTENTQPFEATFIVDDTFEQVYPAVPAGEQVLAIPLGEDEEVIQQLREGVQLTVRLPVSRFTFPLSGTFNAFAALRDCIDAANEILPPLEERPASTDEGAAPDGDGTAEGTAPESDQPTSMGEEALQSLLRAAGLDDVSLVPSEQIPQDELQLDHAWTVGPLVGGVHQTPRTSGDIQINAFMRGYLSVLGQRCGGELEAEVEDPMILLSRYALGAAEVRCITEETTSVMALAFVLDDNFYSAFLHEADLENADMARDATGRILNLVQELAASSGEGQPQSDAPAQAGDEGAGEATDGTDASDGAGDGADDGQGGDAATGN